jgi:hypothetical protein
VCREREMEILTWSQALKNFKDLGRLPPTLSIQELNCKGTGEVGGKIRQVCSHPDQTLKD